MHFIAPNWQLSSDVWQPKTGKVQWYSWNGHTVNKKWYILKCLPQKAIWASRQKAAKPKDPPSTPCWTRPLKSKCPRSAQSVVTALAYMWVQHCKRMLQNAVFKWYMLCIVVSAPLPQHPIWCGKERTWHEGDWCDRVMEVCPAPWHTSQSASTGSNSGWTQNKKTSSSQLQHNITQLKTGK